MLAFKNCLDTITVILYVQLQMLKFANYASFHHQHGLTSPQSDLKCYTLHLIATKSREVTVTVDVARALCLGLHFTTVVSNDTATNHSKWCH